MTGNYCTSLYLMLNIENNKLNWQFYKLEWTIGRVSYFIRWKIAICKTRKCIVYAFCDFYKQKNETIKITYFSTKKAILILKTKYSILIMIYNWEYLLDINNWIIFI